MFNNWCNDNVVTRYLPWDSHGNISVTNELLEMCVKDYEKG